MRTHEIKGGDSLRLHVREWGRVDAPPILLIHGWSQNYRCWQKQFDSPLAQEFRIIAFDLRGHGMSDAPLDAHHYTEARLWAEDVDAVIRQLEVDRPVLVGWSYGGFIICDYVRTFGQNEIIGINLVGGAVTLGAAAFGTLIGPGFLEPFQGATADDLPSNIEAMRRFVRGCVAKPLAADLYEEALCWNIVVPAKVRLAMAQREIRSDDVLGSLKLPVLVTHGDVDIVVLPAMVEHVLATCPTAKVSWFEGVGHAPHLEDPARFNAELAEFTRAVHAVPMVTAG